MKIDLQHTHSQTYYIIVNFFLIYCKQKQARAKRSAGQQLTQEEDQLLLKLDQDNAKNNAKVFVFNQIPFRILLK